LPDIGRDHRIAGRLCLDRRQHPASSSEKEGGSAAANRLKAQLWVTTAIHVTAITLVSIEKMRLPPNSWSLILGARPAPGRDPASGARIWRRARTLRPKWVLAGLVSFLMLIFLLRMDRFQTHTTVLG